MGSKALFNLLFFGRSRGARRTDSATRAAPATTMELDPEAGRYRDGMGVGAPASRWSGGCGQYQDYGTKSEAGSSPARGELCLTHDSGMDRPAKSFSELRVLVAEDESLIAMDIEAMLDGMGCKVVGPFAQLDQIIDAVGRERPDGALLDVNLRGQQIFRVLPEILAHGIPVVLTSGYDDATLFPDEFRRLPRLSKPFDEKMLRQICQRTFLRGGA